MNNAFHRDWDIRLRGIAHNWSRKYVWLDEEEAYSELLVWYAKACLNYNTSKGTFQSFFYYYMRKAYKALKDLWLNENYMADWDLETCLDLEDETAEVALHNMLIELDKTYLTEDAKQMLKFILTTDLTGKTKRVGSRTVQDKAHTLLGWSYKRTQAAIKTLKNFYGERAIA